MSAMDVDDDVPTEVAPAPPARPRGRPRSTPNGRQADCLPSQPPPPDADPEPCVVLGSDSEGEGEAEAAPPPPKRQRVARSAKPPATGKKGPAGVVAAEAAEGPPNAVANIAGGGAEADADAGPAKSRRGRPAKPKPAAPKAANAPAKAAAKPPAPRKGTATAKPKPQPQPKPKAAAKGKAKPPAENSKAKGLRDDTAAYMARLQQREQARLAGPRRVVVQIDPDSESEGDDDEDEDEEEGDEEEEEEGGEEEGEEEEAEEESDESSSSASVAEYWDSAPAVGKAAKKKGRGGRPANPYLLPPAAYRKPDVQRRVINPAKEAGERTVVLPEGVFTELKPHQFNALKFLWKLIVQPPKESLRGCILAHTMGLGKTLTSLAFVTLLWRTHRHLGRVLVLCPKIVVGNWRAEVERWRRPLQCPALQSALWAITDDMTPQQRVEEVQEWADVSRGILVMGYETFKNMMRVTQRYRRQAVSPPSGPATADPPPAPAEEEEPPADAGEAPAAAPAPAPDAVPGADGPPVAVAKRRGRPKGPAPCDEERLDGVLAKETHVLIVDEGHRIKDVRGLLRVALDKVETRRRVVLTGTPLQNNLMEYFAMVDWVRPGHWTEKEFKALFAETISEGQNKDSSPEQISLMKKRSYVLWQSLRDFVDRRDYQTLAKDLPPKTEATVMVPLAPLQQQLYEAFLQHHGHHGDLIKHNLLLKICNHPELFRAFCDRKAVRARPAAAAKPAAVREKEAEDDEDVERRVESELQTADFDFSWVYPILTRSRGTPVAPPPSSAPQEAAPGTAPDESKDPGDASSSSEPQPYDWGDRAVEESGKLRVLTLIAQECSRVGEKLVVFSQFTETLDVIGEALEARAILYGRVDGTMTDRERREQIDAFSKSKAKDVLLVSTRAGGTGINLVVANRLVLYDVSWNPSHDTQAIARTWRYGQTRPVFVYRFVSDGTSETAVYKRQATKEWLFNRVVDSRVQARNFLRRDLEINAFAPEPWSEAEIEESRRTKDGDPLLGRVYDRLDGQLKLLKHQSWFKDDYTDELTPEEQADAQVEFEQLKQRVISEVTARRPYLPAERRPAATPAAGVPFVPGRPMTPQQLDQLVLLTLTNPSPSFAKQLNQWLAALPEDQRKTFLEQWRVRSAVIQQQLAQQQQQQQQFQQRLKEELQRQRDRLSRAQEETPASTTSPAAEDRPAPTGGATASSTTVQGPTPPIGTEDRLREVLQLHASPQWQRLLWQQAEERAQLERRVAERTKQINDQATQRLQELGADAAPDDSKVQAGRQEVLRDVHRFRQQALKQAQQLQLHQERERQTLLVQWRWQQQQQPPRPAGQAAASSSNSAGAEGKPSDPRSDAVGAPPEPPPEAEGAEQREEEDDEEGNVSPDLLAGREETEMDWTEGPDKARDGGTALSPPDTGTVT